MKYTIVVYFDEPGKFDYPLNHQSYLDSYRDFAAYCTANNTDLYICRGNTYLGNMTFTSGWKFENGELIDVNEKIKAHLIYVKGLNYVLETTPTDLVVNDLEFDRIGRNKWLTYQAFSDYMPVTHEIHHDNWQQVRDAIPSEKIVLKPILGSGGKGIVIADREDFDFPSLEINEPYIAQEFIDSSKGIPGLCVGYHDLRIMMFNGEPKLSFIRVPKEGNILSNIAQGGQAIVVPIHDIPQEMLDMARAIHEFYGKYEPPLYTTDFFMGNDGRSYLIETNTRPGITAHTPEYAQEYYKNLHHALIQAIVKKNPTPELP